VRVKFTSLISALDVDLSEVANAGDLDIIGCFDKVNPFECASWHDAGTVRVLGAISNFKFFTVTDLVC
jgi:hypothetical protein